MYKELLESKVSLAGFVMISEAEFEVIAVGPQDEFVAYLECEKAFKALQSLAKPDKDLTLTEFIKKLPVGQDVLVPKQFRFGSVAVVARANGVKLKTKHKAEGFFVTRLY